MNEEIPQQFRVAKSSPSKTYVLRYKSHYNTHGSQHEPMRITTAHTDYNSSYGLQSRYTVYNAHTDYNLIWKQKGMQG